MFHRHPPPTRPDVQIVMTNHVMRRLIERWDKWRVQSVISWMDRQQLEEVIRQLSASGELPVKAILVAIANRSGGFDRPNSQPGLYHRYFAVEGERGERHGEIVYSVNRPETDTSPAEIVIVTIYPPSSKSYRK